MQVNWRNWRETEVYMHNNAPIISVILWQDKQILTGRRAIQTDACDRGSLLQGGSSTSPVSLSLAIIILK